MEKQFYRKNTFLLCFNVQYETRYDHFSEAFSINSRLIEHITSMYTKDSFRLLIGNQMKFKWNMELKRPCPLLVIYM